MKKTVFTIMLLIGCITFGSSQSDLNKYKYIIVPNKYEFLKEPNMYQLNALTKFLFNKYGFTAIMEDESLTQELLDKPCLALRTDLVNNSGLFKTKLIVKLKNCMDEVVFTTREGETREKDYGRAYNFAIRDAFVSFQTVNYEYQPDEESAPASTSVVVDNNEVEKLKEEIKALKEEKELQAKEEVKPVVEEKEAVMESIPNEVSQEVKAPVIKLEEPVAEVSPEMPETNEFVDQPTVSSNVLYAQPTGNGFQLVDSTPKVVYKIKRSGSSDMYFVEGTQAIIYKSGSEWILEYYEDDTLKKEVLNIKF